MDKTSKKIVLSTSDNSDELQSEYNTYYFQKINDSYAIVTVESQYVLYSSQSRNIFSTSICNIYNQDIFRSGREYSFINTVEFSYKYDENSEKRIYVPQSGNITLLANTPPIGGNCSVTPKIGSALTDKFEIRCDGWQDYDGDYDDDDDYDYYNTNYTSNNVTYNFIYNDLLFLKSSYDYDATVNTIAGAGNITVTAVILDENLLPTCMDINFLATYDESAWDDYTTATFGDWIDSIFSSVGNGSLPLAQTALIVDAVYDLTVRYLSSTSDSEETTTLEEQSRIAALQTKIIETFIDLGSEQVESVYEATTVVSVMAKTTNPIIDTNVSVRELVNVDNGDENEDGVSVAVYDTSLVTGVLDNVKDPMVAVFQNSVISGETENVDSNTAQKVFGM